MRELVRDGVTGLLAVRGDADDFAQQLARLMDDDTMRRAMGGRAREAIEAYQVDAVLDRWELLLSA